MFRSIIAVAVLLVICSAAVGQPPVAIPTIDAASIGTPFSRGVRGQAIPSINQFRPPATIGTQMSLDIARGSSIRGVAGGLEADFYDWRNRSNDQRSTTLEYLALPGTATPNSSSRPTSAAWVNRIRRLPPPTTAASTTRRSRRSRRWPPIGSATRTSLREYRKRHDCRPAQQGRRRLARLEYRPDGYPRHASHPHRSEAAESEVLGNRQRASRRPDEQLQLYEQLHVSHSGASGRLDAQVRLPRAVRIAYLRDASRRPYDQSWPCHAVA